MFIKTSKFKKMMKEAYKGGRLHMARVGDCLIINTGYTMIEADITKMLPAEKAAVIEFSGELPEEGEAWLCTEAGNQMEISAYTERDKLSNMKRMISDDWEATYILVAVPGTTARAVQSTEDNQILWFCESFLQQVVTKCTREDEIFDGKLKIAENCAVFSSNVMTYVILPVNLHHQRLNDLLGNMELYKNDWEKDGK